MCLVVLGILEPFSGYDVPEKVAIALKYLVPKALVESGLEVILTSESHYIF